MAMKYYYCLCLVLMAHYSHGASPVVPSSDILAWTKMEIGAFYSFNMITMLNVSDTQDFCIGVGGDATWLPPPDFFNPELLDLDQWARAAAALGAKYAVLTTQHCSGFSLWPTDIEEYAGFDYTYSTRYSNFRGGSYDVVKEFVNACAKYSIKPGIYYSLNQNFYLNVGHGVVLNTTLVPGQRKVTQEQYGLVVLAQMRELWTNYGELAEVWFDGGCSVPEITQVVTEYLFTLQPHAVYFNDCPLDFHNAIRWVGTESGLPAYPIWSYSSNCAASGSGNPDGGYFCPAESDTTLQENDHWFWRKGLPIRSLSELQDVYYHTVGQNTNLLLNMAANSSGLIEDTSVQRYQEFGDWIRGCFETSVAETNGRGYYFELSKQTNLTFDHILISEDQSIGQLVMNFTVTAILPDSTEVHLLDGESIGNKFIRPITQISVDKVILFITSSSDEPSIQQFSLHYCV